MAHGHLALGPVWSSYRPRTAEMATTVRHEVGHYFGLDEDDMVRLGLD